jgi:hypothetical protein
VRSTDHRTPRYVGVLHSLVTWSLLGPNTFLSTPLPHTLNMRSFLNAAKCHTHTKHKEKLYFCVLNCLRFKIANGKTKDSELKKTEDIT